MSRRNRRRVNKQPKLKNQQIIRTGYSFGAPVGDFISSVNLIQNPTILDQNQRTGYVETIGRFSIDCTFEGVATLNNVAVFIMYIPEGFYYGGDYVITEDVVHQHPEWIMAYKYLGSPTELTNDSSPGQGCQPTRVSTRVRRNLKTGDRIDLVILGTNSGSVAVTPTIWALVKFASRIN